MVTGSWLEQATSQALAPAVEAAGAGPKVNGVIGSGRYSAYAFLPLSQRQICWAHLRRDFQRMVDRGGEPAQTGEILLALTDQMFAWWHRVRDGTLQRRSFQM